MTAPGTITKEQLAELISRHIDTRDHRSALIASQRLTHDYPEYAYGWYLASYVLKQARQLGDALRAVDRALELSYADNYLLHKAKCLFEAGEIRAAAGAAATLQDKAFKEAAPHNELGSLLHMLGDQAGALNQYSKAIARDSGVAEFHFNRAAVQRYLGDAAAAEASFDAAIALNPNEYEAYNGRAQLRTQTAEHNHVEQLRRLVAATRSPTGLIQLYYALAKEQEDLGNYSDAFQSLEIGAGIKRRHMHYNPQTDLQIIAKIRDVYKPELFDGRIQGCASRDPIFIVGMPRTGTTLVERILGSHTQVTAAGELNDFGLALTDLIAAPGGPAQRSRLDFVAASSMVDFRALGASYLRRTAPRRGGGSRFIDKLPFNFLYAGLIHLALPQARIISVTRHPMDTCYAVYKQLFKDAYPFSYDLNELGQYFIAYHQLMQHWHRVMPGRIHTVNYESLVADLEGEARRLLQYCELPWEEQCLHFHLSSEASTTASAIQVRRPIYDTSIGKWRHYRQQLEPLRTLLDRAGIDVA
jgi:tetratricopeptide (TPR) repeat protein